jgi:hypothetical protein
MPIVYRAAPGGAPGALRTRAAAPATSVTAAGGGEQTAWLIRYPTLSEGSRQRANGQGRGHWMLGPLYGHAQVIGDVGPSRALFADRLEGKLKSAAVLLPLRENIPTI